MDTGRRHSPPRRRLLCGKYIRQEWSVFPLFARIRRLQSRNSQRPKRRLHLRIGDRKRRFYSHAPTARWKHQNRAYRLQHGGDENNGRHARRRGSGGDDFCYRNREQRWEHHCELYPDPAPGLYARKEPSVFQSITVVKDTGRRARIAALTGRDTLHYRYL